jgi:hypothetical protein
MRFKPYQEKAFLLQGGFNELYKFLGWFCLKREYFILGIILSEKPSLNAKMGFSSP